ncbi:MAG: ABC transporter substrate-binding protein, partial [Desulfobacterales bacterium]|nr:ABC transporter substrate-binding protein [Desulfobacterales bacterium]
MLSLFSVSYGKGVYAVMFGLCVALLIGPLMLPGHALAAGEGGDDGALCIAVAGPMSGPEKRHGEETVKIVTMRVEQFNKSGGVNGEKIRVLAFDDKNDVENAEKAARKIAGNNNILLVIGHRYSGASIAAGRIYKKHRIPAITASATAEMVTRDNDWSFRTIFNNQQQGSLLATYVCRILGRNIASIIYDEDAFGRGLTKSFENASQEFGLTVNYKWGFDRKRDDLEKQLSDIVDELKEARNCGIVFLAVHERQGASLIRKIREIGLSVPLIGSDALAKQSFPLQFKDFPMEKLNPGFSTNDLHVASYYLSDTADLDGKRVHNEYVATFKKEPDASAMTTYDAISLGLEAIGKTGAKETDPARRRKKIRDFLAGVNGMNSAYKGVTGYIYFDEEGDAQKSVPVGVFKNNRLISAPVQLSPVKDFKE